MIFTYWEGRKPAYIDLCHQTLMTQNSDAVVLTPEKVRELKACDRYIDDPFFKELKPAHRADIIRIKVLEEFGGVWVDSDFISMQSFDPLIESSLRRHALYYYKDSWQATNGILIAPKNHMMVVEWSRKIDAVFANLKRVGSLDIPWCSFGADQLKVVIGNAIENHEDLGWDRVQLIPYQEVERFFIAQNVRDHSWPACYGYMLFNATGIPDWFRQLSEQAILEGPWVISHLFRVALGKDVH